MSAPGRGVLVGLFGALLAALGAAVRLGGEWSRRLEIPAVEGQILAAQASGGGGGRIYQRLSRTASARSAEYGFVNFNRDRLNVSYQVPESAFQRYNDDYGYRTEDIDALRRWRDAELQRSFKAAVAQGRSQAHVDAQAAAIQKSYDAKVKAYLADRGFVLEPGGVTRIDMPGIVRRNGPLIKPLSQTFDDIARQRRYGSLDIIGAVLSFAQTAIQYKQPEAVHGGKRTGGILPPITTVLLGWGDCDTKTALVASILSNWGQMRMVGVSVPGHYLMAVLQIPDKGDLFVEYQGLRYVLLEPAGPAWLPPGQVAEETVAQLDGEYRILPFF